MEAPAAAKRIERTGWAVAAALVAGSLFLGSQPVTAGVALGALVALLGYRSLVRFASAVLASGAPSVPRFRFALYLLKYAVIAAVLFAALKYRVADAVAILAGASVLLPAIARETIASRGTLREEA